MKNENDERKEMFIKSEFGVVFQNLKITSNLKKTLYFHLFFSILENMIE